MWLKNELGAEKGNKWQKSVPTMIWPTKCHKKQTLLQNTGLAEPTTNLKQAVSVYELNIVLFA